MGEENRIIITGEACEKIEGLKSPSSILFHEREKSILQRKAIDPRF